VKVKVIEPVLPAISETTPVAVPEEVSPWLDIDKYELIRDYYAWHWENNRDGHAPDFFNWYLKDLLKHNKLDDLKFNGGVLVYPEGDNFRVSWMNGSTIVPADFMTEPDPTEVTPVAVSEPKLSAKEMMSLFNLEGEQEVSDKLVSDAVNAFDAALQEAWKMSPIRPNVFVIPKAESESLEINPGLFPDVPQRQAPALGLRVRSSETDSGIEIVGE
jgi:hypothetical protein